MTKWQARGVFAALGAALSLIHEPFNLWPAAFGVLWAVFYLSRQGFGPLSGFGAGWFLGLGYFAISLHWIVHPFFIDPLKHGWFFPIGILGLSGGMAVFWGVSLALTGSARSKGFATLPTLIVCFTLIEAVRGVIFTGFPWAMLAQGVVDTGLGQALAWVGPHGLGLLIMGIAALPFAIPRWGWVMALLVFASLEGAGHWRLGAPTEFTDFRVRLLQANNDQALKFDPTYSQQFFRENLELSRQAGAYDLVIWPENAVIWELSANTQVRSMIAEAALGAPSFVGGVHAVDDSYFNTMAAISTDGSVLRYSDKYHLVPFGEYIPFRFVLRAIGLEGLFPPPFTPSRGINVETVEGIPPYLPLICYEMIFPRYARIAEERPDWIVQVTNDAWFGNFAGPYQHLAQARMRAIEQGLPVARVANTGVSAIIDGQGRIIASLPLNARAALDQDLPKALPRTLYNQIGNWGAYFMLALLAGLAVFGRARGRPNSVDPASRPV